VKLLRSAALWIVFTIPLGKAAPWVMGFALRSWPQKVTK
jgi:hypothetical protein